MCNLEVHLIVLWEEFQLKQTTYRTRGSPLSHHWPSVGSIITNLQKLRIEAKCLRKVQFAYNSVDYHSLF